MPVRAASRHALLRELYIGISNYTRCRITPLPSRRAFVCQAALRDGMTQASNDASEQQLIEDMSTSSIVRRIDTGPVNLKDGADCEHAHSVQMLRGSHTQHYYLRQH